MLSDDLAIQAEGMFHTDSWRIKGDDIATVLTRSRDRYHMRVRVHYMLNGSPCTVTRTTFSEALRTLAQEYLVDNPGIDDDLWQLVDNVEIDGLLDRLDYSTLIHQHQLLAEGYGWLSQSQCHRLLGSSGLVLLHM
jgi:hypothetical protein